MMNAKDFNRRLFGASSLFSGQVALLIAIGSLDSGLGQSEPLWVTLTWISLIPFALIAFVGGMFLAFTPRGAHTP